MAEQHQSKLFREKSLESIESPEALNDYLRVTSPGIWLVLAAIVLILVGTIVWGVFGRIETTATLAVQAENDTTTCYVPKDIMDKVVEQDAVTIDGKPYKFKMDGNVGVTVVDDNTNPVVVVVGSLEPGEMVMEAPLDARLSDGVYEGTVVIESLQPISLLLQQ